MRSSVIYRNKETPFEIQSEEDWKKVKLGWYISYICNKCGKRHVKMFINQKCKNTCSSNFRNKETPFEIQSEEDWKKVKGNWWVSYICNECGKRHVKIISRNHKNTCLTKNKYYNKETPFEIKYEEDWNKVKDSWYVSYICNECGERHVKIISNQNNKNTCLNKIQYRNKETPFEIKSEEDWKKVKLSWYVSYICNKCGKRHVKVIVSKKRINTCLNKIPYRNKETPFEIQSEKDWKKVKGSWWVSYICNECGEKHVKKISGIKNAKNTCIKKLNNIKINYKSNYVDRFIFAY